MFARWASHVSTFEWRSFKPAEPAECSEVEAVDIDDDYDDDDDGDGDGDGGGDGGGNGNSGGESDEKSGKPKPSAMRDWPIASRVGSSVLNARGDLGDSPRHVGSELIALLKDNVGVGEAASLLKLCTAIVGWQEKVASRAAKHNKWEWDDDDEF